ncbi:GspH/FimT family pseudopilin [Candidatus Pacearchaeota archaeon]|nr:GspH/FimT family pseudopilin [Candidatus Pacearchaeota archaeon]
MDYNIHMNKNIQGFTLIELIVTLAVVSILLLTGIPMLNQMTTNNRLVTQINNIAGSLALARSESIKRGSSITLCGSTDGAACDTANWESGWIIFADVNNNATLESATDTMLKIVTKFSGGSTLRLSRSDSTSVIRYKSDGGLRDIDSSITGISNRGTFTLCDNNLSTTKARAININPIGRVSRAEGATATEKPVHDVTGVDITCP